MTPSHRYSSGAPWEDVVGYSRALRVGRHIYVSGTTATDEHGQVVSPGDAYAQALQAMRNALSALQALGASAGDVVRTRMFVTDISRWREYGAAHKECFGQARPTTSMLEVSRLIHPDMMIEVEVEALVQAPEDSSPC